MAFSIHFPLKNNLEFESKRYRITTWFDSVLKVFAIQKEKDLSDADKLELSLDLLTKGKRKLSIEASARLFKAIFDEFITTDKKRGENGKLPSFDFIQDAEYIYASFYSEYGMDLIKEQGRLDWRKFIALFSGLSENSKIVKIIEIRDKPIPNGNKNNSEERARILKLKQYYALEYSQEEREKSLAESFKNAFGKMR